MILENNSRKNTHLTTRVFASSFDVLQWDIPAFNEGVLICYMWRIPPSVAHCLPLSAPVTARPVVWFVFHRGTLHKRGLSPKALDKNPSCDLQTLKSSQRVACPEEVVVKIAPVRLNEKRWSASSTVFTCFCAWFRLRKGSRNRKKEHKKLFKVPHLRLQDVFIVFLDEIMLPTKCAFASRRPRYMSELNGRVYFYFHWDQFVCRNHSTAFFL